MKHAEQVCRKVKQSRIAMSSVPKVTFILLIGA